MVWLIALLAKEIGIGNAHLIDEIKDGKEMAYYVDEEARGGERNIWKSIYKKAQYG